MNKKNYLENRIKWAMPDSYIILFILMLLATFFTYLIPAGKYDRVPGKILSVVVPNSYHTVTTNPINFMDFFLSIQTGMVQASGIIALVLIIGGAFAVIESTGAINSAVMTLIEKTKKRRTLLVISVCSILSVAGFLGILHTAVIAFVPIGVLIARAFKLDAICGVAIIYLGAYAGYSIGGLDPITTGFAQEIAGLPIFSGLWFRFIVYIFILLASIFYILHYMRKITYNPSKSIMGENKFGNDDITENSITINSFTLRQKTILLYFTTCMTIYTIGVFNADWGLNHMSAIFIIIAIGSAIIAKISPNEFVKRFIKGAQSMVYAAMIVGLARSIVVLLEQGMILDTIVNSIASLLETMPTWVSIQGMYYFNLLFNLIITSGSGQAAIVMPIMAPLADVLEVNRQIAVLAYNFGDGFTNTIAPTSGILMASIAVAKVSWVQWLRFMMPLLFIWTIIGSIALVIAEIINLGPW